MEGVEVEGVVEVGEGKGEGEESTISRDREAILEASEVEAEAITDLVPTTVGGRAVSSSSSSSRGTSTTPAELLRGGIATQEGGFEGSPLEEEKTGVVVVVEEKTSATETPIGPALRRGTGAEEDQGSQQQVPMMSVEEICEEG